MTDRYIKKEFGMVNLVVEASGKEVKLWACSPEGMSVFRLKVTGGQIHFNPAPQHFHDVIIRQEGKSQ